MLQLGAAMANPIQQGLKPNPHDIDRIQRAAAMANPIQQGLKQVFAGDDGGAGTGRNG